MPLSFQPPPPLRHDRFHIRPQRAADNGSDYAAVMANRGWLRRWSGSPWPDDAFSLADNLEDLRGHIADHAGGEAYGFSITEPDDRSILGSLYVNDLAALLREYSTTAPVSDATARIDVWTRLDRPDDVALLRDVVAASRAWFADQWRVEVVWGARIDCPELEHAYASADLRRVARLVHPETKRVHLLFG